MNPQEIVLALRAKGLTQQKIADLSGYSQPTICDIEAGKLGQTRPSYKLIESLQRVLDDESAKEVSQ